MKSALAERLEEAQKYPARQPARRADEQFRMPAETRALAGAAFVAPPWGKSVTITSSTPGLPSLGNTAPTQAQSFWNAPQNTLAKYVQKIPRDPYGTDVVIIGADYPLEPPGTFKVL